MIQITLNVVGKIHRNLTAQAKNNVAFIWNMNLSGNDQ